MTATHHQVRVRRARAADADAVAEVYLASFRSAYAFPLAQPEGDVREWIATHVVSELETWVAVDRGDVIALVALSGSTVEQLYVAPNRTGEGTGSTLLGLAQERRPAGLELWTFQVNEGARRFYARHGFDEVELTDGSANEEGQPDVRLVWRAEP